MWYWYIARPDELLLDIDRPWAKTRKGGTFYEEFFRKRLQSAVEQNKLPMEHHSQYWLTITPRLGRHIYIRLTKPLPLFERMAWQLWLGSDLYRGRADLMRAAKGHKYPSLLIETQKGFRCLSHSFREPDAWCRCEDKHRTEKRPRCKAWLKYRGPSPWALFGKPLP